jgi:O-antigen/teichoic acid export membrane protein
MKRSSARARATPFAEVSWITAARYVSEALYLARGMLLARLLGPDMFGVWSSMRLVRRFANFSPLGSTQGMLQLSPLAAGRGDVERAHHYRRTAVGFGLGAALLVAICVAAVAWSRSGPVEAGQRHLWLAFAAVLVVAQLHELQLTVLRSQQRFALVSAAHVGVAVCSTLLGVIAAWRFGLPGFLLALGLSYGAVLVVPARMARPFPRPVADLATTRELIGTGAFILGAQVLQSLMRNVDKLLLWGMLGSRALGIYAVPSYLVNLTLLLPAAVTTVAYPRLLEKSARTGSLSTAWPYLELVTVLLGHLACPILAFLYLTLHLPIAWWLPDYVAAVAPGRILLLLTFLPIVAALPATVLISLGAQGRLLAIRAVAVAVSCVAVTATIRGGGSLAAVALAMAPGFAWLSIATLVAALRHAELPRRRRARVLLWVFAPYLLLLTLLAAFGSTGYDPVDSWRGALSEVLTQVGLVCGGLLAWGAWATHRLGLLAWWRAP